MTSPRIEAGCKRVGALLDHIGLYPRLTARENLVYFTRLRGLRRTELEQRMERVSTLCGCVRSPGDRDSALARIAEVAGRVLGA